MKSISYHSTDEKIIHILGRYLQTLKQEKWNVYLFMYHCMYYYCILGMNHMCQYSLFDIINV